MERLSGFLFNQDIKKVYIMKQFVTFYQYQQIDYHLKIFDEVGGVISISSIQKIMEEVKAVMI